MILENMSVVLVPITQFILHSRSVHGMYDNSDRVTNFVNIYIYVYIYTF